jgi:NTP pyrophosphatase (non-canonical NTP hydrolase)
MNCSDSCRLEFYDGMFLRVRRALGKLAERGYGGRERLQRKMAEELGEYAEAIEYFNGATRKVAKFKDKVSPEEKLCEEAVDMLMIACAIVQAEGIDIFDALEAVAAKLDEREKGK